MSEANHERDEENGERQNETNEHVEEVDWKVKFSELESRTTELESTNDRLLSQSKDWKSKAQSYKTELDEVKEKSVERQSSEKQVQFYKGKYEEKEAENVDLRTSILKSDMRSKFLEVAKDCRKVDLVLNNPEYEADLKSAIDVSNLTVDKNVLETVYSRDKESNPFLYGGKRLPDMAGGGAVPDTNETTVDVGKLSPDEYREYILKKYSKSN